MPLPNPGDLNWGLPLNDYILNEVQQLAQDATDTLTTHTAPGGDPHGQKSYTDAQIAAITATYDQPNGRAGLGGDGRLKASQAPTGGGRANIYDVVGDFGAVPNSGADQTTAIQNALTAAANAGGGEVWLGDGVFNIATTLRIGANTHFHLSDGATLRRSNTSVTSTMIRNYGVESNDSGYNGVGNIMISGGKIDGGATGNAIAVTPLAFGHGDRITIKDVTIQNVVDAPAIILGGCRKVTIDNVIFQGLRISNPGVTNGHWRQPAVNMDHARAASLGIGGAFDNTPCEDVTINNCTMRGLGSYASFGKLVDSKNPVANNGHKRLWVTNNYITGAHEYAVMVIGVRDAIISRNTMDSCNGAVYAVVPDSWSNGGFGGVLSGLSISDNSVSNSGQINLSEAVRARCIYAGGRYDGGGSGLYVGVSITNNRIISWGANNRGIEIDHCYQAVINGNIIAHGTQTSITYGILLDDSAESLVSANRVGSGTQYGIYLRSGSRETSISGNVVDGANQYSIYLTDTTKCAISGNVTSSTGGTWSVEVGTGASALIVGNRFDKDIHSHTLGEYFTVVSGAPGGNLYN